MRSDRRTLYSLSFVHRRRCVMLGNLIEVTPSAYEFPLLIKHLLHSPLTRAPEQVIVYRERRHTYRQFRDRLGRLASALTDLGVKAGDVVAVLDWDSHRYHECYFAIPMMGAVLQTGNLALPPEQLLYTLNDTGASTLLLNVDFLPLIEPLASRLPNVSRFILLNDRPDLPTTTLPVAGEYEALIETSSPFFVFPDFDERTRATTFHTTGTTGKPKGVYFSHRQILLHVFSTLTELGVATVQGRVHRDDVYMPMTPILPASCGRGGWCHRRSRRLSWRKAEGLRQTQGWLAAPYARRVEGVSERPARQARDDRRAGAMRRPAEDRGRQDLEEGLARGRGTAARRLD